MSCSRRSAESSTRPTSTTPNGRGDPIDWRGNQSLHRRGLGRARPAGSQRRKPPCQVSRESQQDNSYMYRYTFTLTTVNYAFTLTATLSHTHTHYLVLYCRNNYRWSHNMTSKMSHVITALISIVTIYHTIIATRVASHLARSDTPNIT